MIKVIGIILVVTSSPKSLTKQKLPYFSIHWTYYRLQLLLNELQLKDWLYHFLSTIVAYESHPKIIDYPEKLFKERVSNTDNSETNERRLKEKLVK